MIRAPRVFSLFAAFAGAAAMVAGCGAGDPPPPKRPAPERAPVEVVPADLASGTWGEYRSARFDLKLPLPDGPRWRVEDSGSPWLEATHEEAATKLLVRTWREAGASRAACEARARLWKDLPAREGAEVVDRRRIDVPPGFDTIVEVGVRPEAPRKKGAAGELAIAGFAMAFGGWAQRCFAYVLTTSASGKDAERLIAVRLATMVELSLLNVGVERETDPAAIPREPVR